jgi:hypothetical protein
MIGSPGIGKSFSLLYALQQALLYDRALVLLYSCCQFETYLLRQEANKIYAWKSTNKGTAASSLMDRLDCLVLYNPPEADSGGARYSTVSCQKSLPCPQTQGMLQEGQ